MAYSRQVITFDVLYAFVSICAMPVYVLFVSSTLGIVFNTSAGAITDHSQLAKDI